MLICNVHTSLFARNRSWLALAAACLLGLFTFNSQQVSAQSDPFGETDSVIVSDVTVRPKVSFVLQVRLINDENLTGFTIPLHYPTDLVKLDSVSYSASRASDWSFLNATTDEEAGTVILSGVALDGPALSSGNGELASMHFTSLGNLADGATGLVDSGFVEPTGAFELNTADLVTLVPAFSAGVITIDASNRAPEVAPIPPITVMEGENVSISVQCSDPDDDDVELFATNLAPGSIFDQTARYQGTFAWNVPFVGPGSATDSPYNVEIVAFDGKATTRYTVLVTVINVNRSPGISIGADLSGQSGDELFVPFAGSDPDFDAISFTAEGLPGEVEFNGGNPGFIRWFSALEDSGDYDFNLTAIDEHGSSTTEFLTLQLLPSAPVEMSIGEAQGFSGELVDLYINVHNRVPIAAFDLVLDVDQSILTLVDVDTAGTRLTDWAEFDYTQSSDGTLFISARSDAATPAANPLPEGDGAVVHIRFAISSSTQYAGQYSRVDFAVIDPSDESENAAYQADGVLIPRSQIEYSEGGVLVKKYEGLVGDINLNGVAFDIGDLVYFTNFFVDPVQYPLDGARLQNSDINQNGHPGELADLVMMIQIINGSTGKLAASTAKPAADYRWSQSDDVYSFGFSERAAFAAALISLEMSEPGNVSCQLAEGNGQLEIHVGKLQEQLRVLVVSRDGRLTEIAGASEFLRVYSDVTVELTSAQFIDERGAAIKSSSLDKGVLPDAFSLEQNYPNPFNPQTTISFGIPRASHTKVEVFNILGEKILTLVDKVLPAGRHQVIFRGRNQSDQELPSGIYFYRLRTDAFEATRKMILLK